MSNTPPAFEPSETPMPAGQIRLTNAESQPIAEKLYLELAAEFHPSAMIKIISNMEKQQAKRNKIEQTAYQVARAMGL
jgi:hypothetical protein